MPRILPPTDSNITLAAQALRDGRAVAFPTETVYGLGALTFDMRGLEAVYQLKGRPRSNPLIAHVLDAGQTRSVVADGAWDTRCELLAQRFWPGPLTLVVRRSRRVPGRATAALPTIAVRSPAHPVARALLDAVRDTSPISAPSANRSGRVSPTSAQHVIDEFAGVAEARDLIILDGGACDVGIESTVLDVSGPTAAPPRILRPGSVSREQLHNALGGDVEEPRIDSQSASPGTSLAHYAPRTPAELAGPANAGRLRARLDELARDGRAAAVLCFDASGIAAPHRAIVMPHDAACYARELYRYLREADALGLDAIVIESPPPPMGGQWRAIHDRLRRATAGR